MLAIATLYEVNIPFCSLVPASFYFCATQRAVPMYACCILYSLFSWNSWIYTSMYIIFFGLQKENCSRRYVAFYRLKRCLNHTLHMLCDLFNECVTINYKYYALSNQLTKIHTHNFPDLTLRNWFSINSRFLCALIKSLALIRKKSTTSANDKKKKQQTTEPFSLSLSLSICNTFNVSCLLSILFFLLLFYWSLDYCYDNNWNIALSLSASGESTSNHRMN